MGETIHRNAAWRHLMAFSSRPPGFIVANNSLFNIDTAASAGWAWMATSALTTIATKIIGSATETSFVSQEHTETVPVIWVLETGHEGVDFDR